MSNIGGYAVARSNPDSRFYHRPTVRRQQHRQLLLLQQRQRREGVNWTESRIGHSGCRASRTVLADDDEEEEAEESAALSPRPSSSATREESCLTNLDRLIEAVTPSVKAQNINEVRTGRLRSLEGDSRPYYFLEDLWGSFREWSVYGVGVPLMLNQGECVKQYYVPSLSGIQLYIDPSRLGRFDEDADVETSRETSSGGSGDCQVDRTVKSVTDVSRKMNGLVITDKSSMSSSSNEVGFSKSSGLLVFHYVEQEQPHHRRPFCDKISCLASLFPDLKKYRSCDVLPTSWISMAWYPIYRIPVGPTLQNLDASFLTFHCLSTHSRNLTRRFFHSGIYEPRLRVSSGKPINGAVTPPNFSVPVFGLASYKLKSSILTPSGINECQRGASLLQAAGDWLQKLQVNLPDYQFFVSHSNTQWR